MSRADAGKGDRLACAVSGLTPQRERPIVIIERLLRVAQTVVERADIGEHDRHCPRGADGALQRERLLEVCERLLRLPHHSKNRAHAVQSRGFLAAIAGGAQHWKRDRKSTRLNSSHLGISYAVFCLKKKKKTTKDKNNRKNTQKHKTLKPPKQQQ